MNEPKFDSMVIRDNQPEYIAGRTAQRNGKDVSQNPHPKDGKRIAWYSGWYDQFFRTKYGEPWPA